METIAVYWEPHIKTYGFQQVPDVCLLEFTVDVDQADTWGRRLCTLDSAGTGFLFTMAQNQDGRRLRFYLCFGLSKKEHMMEQMKRVADDQEHKLFHVSAPVELLYFHGPHFGDRYGIAHAALTVLARERIPVLLAGCSVSSIYLVLPEGASPRAMEFLAENFEKPS